jgi:uncharacterized coiled-coil protein SlyX
MSKFNVERPGAPQAKPVQRAEVTLEQRVASLEQTVEELQGQIAALQKHTHELHWLGWMAPPWAVPEGGGQPDKILIAFTPSVQVDQAKKTTPPVY